MKQLSYLLASLLFTGCASTEFLSTNDLPPVVVSEKQAAFPSIIQWSAYSEPNGPEKWLAEAKLRFKDPIVFACHGGPFDAIVTSDGKPAKDKDGNEIHDYKWYCYPDPPRKPLDMQNVADMLRNLYPKQQIVLMVCNEKGTTIRGKGVFYALHKVWITPDRYSPLISVPYRSLYSAKEGTVGTIWRFVEGK